MATAVLPNDNFYPNTDDKSLEIFSLIWLDENANVKETRGTEQKLRSIINHIKKFQDVRQFQQYIEQRSERDRLAIIVSGRLGREIVPLYHQLRQVISIYVYCMDKENHEQWALKFAKVKSVVVDLDELVYQITTDHKIQKKIEEPLSINIFSTSVDAGKSTTGVNGQFVFSQILFDCLLRLKSTEIDKNELINLCENEYEGNYIELNNLHEFQQHYSPDKVLWWYTKESFFYKILNAALRTQDIHRIFLFRAFIYDIYCQLYKSQSKRRLQVYRSQLMSIDELDGLKNNIGQFISINSMFSTSKQRTTALFYLGDITTQIDLERVLFEIDADPKIVTTKPFADISEHSHFPSESEVLFMIGSIFRLDNINLNDDQIWIIKMTLCNDDEHNLKQVLMHMKQQIENEETNLRTLGKLLWKTGKLDLAEKYFTRSLKQLPSNDPLHISLYEDLGELASQRGDYDMSIKWRQKLLTFKKENPLATNVSVNNTKNSIGCKNYIEKTSENDRLVLVTNGKFGQQIIPSIHQLRQISSIYINSEDTQWSNDFPKVKGSHVKMDELVSQIRKDHKNPRKMEEPVWINMFTTLSDAGKSTTAINGQFAFFQVLLDCLLRLKSNENDRNELISYCKKQYEGNQNELNHLHEFQSSYSPDYVLWWYTRESFFYKTLNEALRKENIHMIYLYRSFIIDIQNQLENHQCQCATRVYRSQLMSIDELNYLKNSIGQYVSVNSFLSTSFQKEIATFYLGDTNYRWNDFEKVLFEIDADPKVVTTKPFADISQFSDFIVESEVLFMLGSIFRLNSITRDNQNSFWIIQMCLCSDDEHNLKQILIDMKNEIGNGETNLCILGKVVRRMGHLDLAKKYYYRCLDELSQNDPLVLTVYKDLAKIAFQQKDYEEHLRLRRISARIKDEIQLNDNEIQTSEINKLTDNGKTNIKEKNSLATSASIIKTIGSIGQFIRKKLFAFRKPHQLTVNSNINKANYPIDQTIFVNHININTKWKQLGITVAGGNGEGQELYQLSHPQGIYVDDDHQTIYIADYDNHRIVEWKYGAKNGQVVAGGNEKGNRSDQLNYPTYVIIDKKTNSLIICDYGNKRVVRWSCQNGRNGETIISNIDCCRLAIDKDGHLYVSDWKKNEVRRWKQGVKKGTKVAGGNGQGNHLNQLHYPTYIFVDEDRSVYVSDYENHRVMKWMKGAKEGIVVAGGKGGGNSLTQLSCPQGVVVDHLGNVYVADMWNNRIMRWCKGSGEGSIIVGRNREGNGPNQFNHPRGLSFDVEGNLYVVDYVNHRIQKFDIDSKFNLFEDLGELASHMSDNDMSIQCRQNSLVSKDQNQLTTDSNIGEANKSTGKFIER
ncbi:unnamed protein product [Adineta steineri]|uniref:Uncharacterized protein n=1 Tax=Adineta steineri TaxID=433720 RepID=A0A815ZNE1_9BILA|nr:unnamed protein product [Adineta steineri]CAF1587521.1 unnamed protein product [Adineta steineri]